MIDANKGTKKNLFYLILIILTLIVMIVGVTFSYFALMTSEKKDSTWIKTGTLAIDYIDGRNFNTFFLLPINEPNLDTLYSVSKKKFSVSSMGTLDQTMDIYITVTNNDFANNALGFSIYDSNNQKIGLGRIPSSGKVLMASDIYLKSGDLANFTVLIWLWENNQNQDYEQGSSFSGGFEIDAKQILLK